MSLEREICLKKVTRFIEEYTLLKKGEKTLVALSGGADSVALLLILNELGYHCTAIHCNFHLRGEESNRDEDFVKLLCKEKGIELHKTDFQTYEYAKKRKLSIEMAARELRYKWFEEKRSALNINSIAVAHHSDDAIETFMINLSRGTGIHGLTGIRPRNGAVIRPLLCLSRKEINAYLDSFAQPHVEDSTNRETLYVRNKFRNIIIPMFEEANQAFRTNANETMTNLAMAESFIDNQIKSIKKEIVRRDNTETYISIDGLHKHGNEGFILFEILHPFGFTPSTVKSIASGLNGESGRTYLSQDYRLIKDREYLILQPLADCSQDNYTIHDLSELAVLPIKITAEVLPKENLKILKSKDICYIDAEKLKFPLTLRHWIFGDSFCPFGMDGKKKLSDYFSDQHFSIDKKEKAWILCSDSKIVWIIGERSDNRFRVTDNSKNVVKLHYINN